MAALNRRMALITGATAGIGREFAVQLAREGYNLTLVARDIERLTTLASELQSAQPIAVTVLAADLSDDADTSRVVTHLAAHPVDLLINNAGFGHAGRVGLMDHAKQDAMLRLHVLAVHRLTQAALPAMLERRSGSVIIVASVASFLTSAGNVNYCATKAYDRILAEGLALEAGPHGVYVQALCPGFTHTELHARAGVDKTRWPPWMWMSADRVVATSLAALRAGRPTVVVAGLVFRLLVFAMRFAPRWLVVRGSRGYRRDR